MLIVSYYSEGVSKWVSACDAIACLTWSQKYTNTKGKYSHFIYVDSMLSIWQSKMKKKQRNFRFYDQKSLTRNLSWRDPKKYLEAIEYRPWTYIASYIPKFVNKATMANAAKCFAVTLAYNEKPKSPLSPDFLDMKFSGYAHPFKFSSSNSQFNPGFKMDSIDIARHIHKQQIVKYSCSVRGDLVTTSYSDGESMYQCWSRHYGRPHSLQFDGNVCGWGLATWLTKVAWLEEDSGKMDFMIEVLNVTSCDVGNRIKFNSGSYPQWLYELFFSAGLRIRHLTSDAANDYVMPLAVHGSYMKMIDDDPNVEYCPASLVDPSSDLPFNNSPFIETIDNTLFTNRALSEMCGPFNIL